MRKAINENPIVQIGLLGLLGVVAAVVLLGGMGGGSSAEPEAEEATTATTAEASSATPAVPVEPVAPAAEDVPVAAGTTPFEPGKGLPAEVVDAYESGDVVVLLVMQDRGIEDQKLRQHVQSLEARGDTTVFITDAKNVSRYSRIAEGVSLDRVPAIMVLHPLEGPVSGDEAPPMPEASVAYGYRGENSVAQLVEDARYEGPTDTYAP